MLRLSKKSATHEELFLERYSELMSWASQISRYDRNRAEDLVHDAYIQWTLTRPELQLIQNLDGYLYGMLRNMHASEVRRNFRSPTTSLSVVEYDSALLGLERANDEVQSAHMQEQLREVCAYACVRKETSKAGSLLLLRFFHGYYPSEAALIAGTRRVTVDSWLRIARIEAKLYLDDPEALKFMKESARPAPKFWSARNEWEFLDQITEQISKSCQGSCFGDKKLRMFYLSREADPLDTHALAHIASCESCLAKASKILNLPSKDDRNPPECLGRDPKPGEKSKKARRNQYGPQNLRLEHVTEHRPNELHVAVNGFTVGTQKVISERIEHSLNLSLQEQIGLIEVLSEQGIRLLCMYVESPPNGAIEQAACVHLSDDRTLGVVLNFHEQWPTLELTYSDPHFAEVASDPQTLEAEEITAREDKSQQAHTRTVAFFQFGSLLRTARFNRPFWLRATAITALALLLAMVAYLIVNRSTRLPMASEMLSRAQSAERAESVALNEVLRRTISFEERKSDGTNVRERIEMWQTSSGKTARRLYDAKGALLAGAWQSDGSASQNVFYNHGSKLKVSPPAQSSDHSVPREHLWLLDPSAVTFSAVVSGMPGKVESSGNQYVLTYRQPLEREAKDGASLIEATLVVDRESLRAVSQSFVFDDGGRKRRTYEFRELSRERVPAADVEERVFQPDAELLTPIEQPVSQPPVTSSTVRPPPIEPTHLPTVAELGALEVNILYLLDQINANSGEQIEVRRLPGRELLVEAIVDTDKRKSEIVHALSSISNSRLVRMDVVTLEEALRRETAAQRAPQKLDTIIIASDHIPVYEELRRYVERSGTAPADIENEVRRFSGRMIDQSRQALLHAFALKHLAERFSVTELASLDEESHRKWREMIRTHARGFRQSSAALRRDLSPIFPHLDGGQPSDDIDEIQGDAQLLEAVKSLISLASATDDAISRAFSVGPDTKQVTNGPGSAVFWRTLSRAEGLAAALERIE